MKIIIPMAGEGTRVGANVPKPLVPIVDDKPMIQLALESLDIDAQYTFITRKYQNRGWNLELNDVIRQVVPDSIIVEIDYLTNGPAISALHAPYTFFENEDLIITNCDQILEWNAKKFVDFTKTTEANGAVVTYFSTTPKNSYAAVYENQTDPYPLFSHVREKEIISTYSLNGIHWFKHGYLYPQAVNRMIEAGDTVKGEYYIGPSYTYLTGEKRVYDISPSEHWAVGTVSDIEKYREHYETRSYK
jgi:NDP-sugar pyrophosphorylase family protein